MPKIVDHATRRESITAATCAVIARDGLGSTTMRVIADEAGCTTGMVTHYFSGKREILIAALRHVHRAAGDRMLATLDDVDDAHALHAVIKESLPLDPARLDEWRIWLAFWAQASVDDELATEQRIRYAEWTQLLEHVLDRSGIDASVDGLIAIIDGVGTRAALDPAKLPPARQLSIVADYVRVAAST